MPRNGNGTFNVVNPILIGALRSSSYVNEDFEDAGDELTNSLPIDGQAAMTGQFQAAEGSTTQPPISFKDDTNSGWRNPSADGVRLLTGATARMHVDGNGLLTLFNGIEVTGSVNISSAFSPQSLAAVSQAPVVYRRDENDTTEREIISFERGDGSGAKGSFRTVGSASNNISGMRWYVNNTLSHGIAQSLFTIGQTLNVGTVGPSISGAGHINFVEISTPSAPAANAARLYCRDDVGTTFLFFKDSNGSETKAITGRNRQVFTSSGTWTKPSSGETYAIIEAWGGGGGGGSGSGNDWNAGGGGGGYIRKVIALASLSASVSVTVGSGGASSSAGGNTTFGAYLTAYGGGFGGSTSGAGNVGGGGGGGVSGAGANGNSSAGGDGGGLRGEFGANNWGAGGNGGWSNPFGGGGGSNTVSGSDGGVSFWGGGGGGGSQALNGEKKGGDSIFGGGGGGGRDAGTNTSASGGTSIFGGNGGAGAANGAAPGGGGGGFGQGARGEVRITCW